MKKLGTHNSLSYLPCQWWLRPFAWMGRCQSLTLLEQYRMGVRYFDIRVKYVKGKTVSGHSLLTYDVDIENVLYLLDNYGDCIVRLFLENSWFNPSEHFEDFMSDIQKWQRMYTKTKFVEGGCRFSYRSFITDNVPVRNCYWMLGDKLEIPYPKRFAIENNRKFHHYDNNETYSIYDYIQY